MLFITWNELLYYLESDIGRAYFIMQIIIIIVIINIICCVSNSLFFLICYYYSYVIINPHLFHGKYSAEILLASFSSYFHVWSILDGANYLPT